MTRWTPFARGLLVAITALVLTTGAAFAARQLAPVNHVASLTTSEASEAPEAPEASDAPEASEAPEAPEASDAPEAGDQASKADRKHNHGWYVSQAAHASTPPGFANHGAYVKSVAHSQQGKSPKASKAPHVKGAH